MFPGNLCSECAALCFVHESQNARPTLGRSAIRAVADPGAALLDGSPPAIPYLGFGAAACGLQASCWACGRCGPTGQETSTSRAPSQWAPGARRPLPLGTTPHVRLSPAARCGCRCLVGERDWRGFVAGLVGCAYRQGQSGRTVAAQALSALRQLPPAHLASGPLDFLTLDMQEQPELDVPPHLMPGMRLQH